MSHLTFKNIIIYRLSRDVDLSPETIETHLAPFALTPCGSQDMAKAGWVSPMGKRGTSLFHAVNGQVILCARKEEKILPASVIKEEVQKQIEKIEGEQHRKLKKTERDQLKDEALQSLLPRAFSRFTSVFMWIDTISGLIVVDSPSAKRAEDVLALLRKSLGSLPVTPLTMESPIELTLTEWVRSGQAPAGFSLQDEAQLKAILEEGGTISC
ncbi:TPA: recombination-associated protein RdgC, partial [Serratia fonticola]